MTRLSALLATLLPGDADWPSGGAIADAVTAAMAADPALGTVLAALPEDFAAGDEVTARRIESVHPAAFDRVVNAAYIVYYTTPAVRDALERVAGYPNRPPQPLGYELPTFDERLLDAQKQLAPFWRDPDKEVP